MKPSLAGEAKLALAAWEDEDVFLALGSLLDLERLGTVEESQWPKRGPGEVLSFDAFWGGGWT